jgi:hypothetical protein
MTRSTKIRKSVKTAALLKHSAAVLAGVRVGVVGVVALGWTLGASAERGQNGRESHPAPVVRQAPAANGQRSGFGGGQNRQHLAQWMQSHQNMPLDEQQRALDQEPGFRQLPPEVQQRLHNQLAHLNGMSPEQRERAVERTEAMERLSPEQRVQVRGALSSLGALPQPRRMAVARAFRALREMPEAQRQAYLNSPQMRGQFTDQERVTLNNLFTVAPYLPAPAPPMAAPMPH